MSVAPVSAVGDVELFR
jgi:hypothetical protein